MGISHIRFSLKIVGFEISRPTPRDGGTDGLPYISWQDPDGDRRVLYVNRNPDNRELNLNYPDNRFNDNCVLVGVRSRKPLHFTPAPISWGRKFL